MEYPFFSIFKRACCSTSPTYTQEDQVIACVKVLHATSSHPDSDTQSENGASCIVDVSYSLLPTIAVLQQCTAAKVMYIVVMPRVQKQPFMRFYGSEYSHGA